MKLKTGRASGMIDEEFKYAKPTPPPPPEDPKLVKALEDQGFRPFGYEW